MNRRSAGGTFSELKGENRERANNLDVVRIDSDPAEWQTLAHRLRAKVAEAT
jgi:hypothetical protein